MEKVGCAGKFSHSGGIDWAIGERIIFLLGTKIVYSCVYFGECIEIVIWIECFNGTQHFVVSQCNKSV